MLKALILRTLAALSCMVICFQPGAVSAADPVQQVSLGKFVDQVRLPHTQRLVAVIMTDLQRNAVRQFLEGMGRGAKLPAADWRSGNPQWERAQQRLKSAVSAEESRGGPIFALNRDDFLANFDLPWSTAETEFLAAAADTPYGRSFMHVFDLMIVSVLVKQMGSLKELTPPAVAELQAVDAEARAEFGGATVEIIEREKADPQTAARLKELVERLTHEHGYKLGQAMVKKPMARFMSAVYDCISDLHGIVEEFRQLARDPSRQL